MSVGHEKQVDLKALAAALGVQQNLSFASPDRLKKYLGVEPGSVTLLGLMNDTDHVVSFWIDEDIWNAESIQCHPLVNTATLVIPKKDLERFFEITGHAVHSLTIPTRA